MLSYIKKTYFVPHFILLTIILLALPIMLPTLTKASQTELTPNTQDTQTTQNTQDRQTTQNTQDTNTNIIEIKHLTKARKLAEQGKYKKAVKTFRKALKQTQNQEAREGIEAEIALARAKRKEVVKAKRAKRAKQTAQNTQNTQSAQSKQSKALYYGGQSANPTDNPQPQPQPQPQTKPEQQNQQSQTQQQTQQQALTPQNYDWRLGRLSRVEIALEDLETAKTDYFNDFAKAGKYTSEGDKQKYISGYRVKDKKIQRYREFVFEASTSALTLTQDEQNLNTQARCEGGTLNSAGLGCVGGTGTFIPAKIIAEVGSFTTPTAFCNGGTASPTSTQTACEAGGGTFFSSGTTLHYKMIKARYEDTEATLLPSASTNTGAEDYAWSSGWTGTNVKIGIGAMDNKHGILRHFAIKAVAPEAEVKRQFFNMKGVNHVLATMMKPPYHPDDPRVSPERGSSIWLAHRLDLLMASFEASGHHIVVFPFADERGHMASTKPKNWQHYQDHQLRYTTRYFLPSQILGNNNQPQQNPNTFSSNMLLVLPAGNSAIYCNELIGSTNLTDCNVKAANLLTLRTRGIKEIEHQPAIEPNSIIKIAGTDSKCQLSGQIMPSDNQAECERTGGAFIGGIKPIYKEARAEIKGQKGLEAQPNAGDRVIFVGAINKDDEIYKHSLTAGEYLKYDFIVAWGSAYLFGDAGPVQTGIAASQVAGAAALLRHKFPNLNGASLKQVLLQTATDLGKSGPDPIFGWGKLNLQAALSPQGKVITYPVGTVPRPQIIITKYQFLDTVGETLTIGIETSLNVQTNTLDAVRLNETNTKLINYGSIYFSLPPSNLQIENLRAVMTTSHEGVMIINEITGSITTSQSAIPSIAAEDANDLKIINKGLIRTTGSDRVQAIFIERFSEFQNATIINEATGTIKTAGDNSSAIEARNIKGILKITNKGLVETTKTGSSSSYGVSIDGVENVIVENKIEGQIATRGEGTYGIYLSSATGDTIRITNQGSIKTQAESANGVYVKSLARGIVENYGIIETQATNANGIFVEDSNNVTIANHSTIETQAESANGIFVESESSNIAINHFAGTLITKGNSAHGIHTTGNANMISIAGCITTTAAGANAIRSTGSSSQVRLLNGAVISSTTDTDIAGRDSVAIHLRNTQTLTILPYVRIIGLIDIDTDADSKMIDLRLSASLFGTSQFGNASTFSAANQALTEAITAYKNALTGLNVTPNQANTAIAATDTSARTAWGLGWTGKNVAIGFIESEGINTANTEFVIKSVAPEASVSSATLTDNTQVRNLIANNNIILFAQSFQRNRGEGYGTDEAWVEFINSQLDTTSGYMSSSKDISSPTLPQAAGVFDVNIVFVFSAGDDKIECQAATSSPEIKDCNIAAGILATKRKTEINAGDRALFVGALADDDGKPSTQDVLASYSLQAGTDLKYDFMVAYDDVHIARDASRTAYAAARVASAAALVRHKFPNLDGAALKQVLVQTADDLGEAGADPIYGAGKLNLEKALSPIGNIVTR